MATVFADWIREIRDALGPAPRKVSGATLKTAFATPKPAWCVPPDPMRLFFKEKGRLLVEGEVTTGIVVQANAAAFSRGPYTHPADILYRADASATTDATSLADVRDRLVELRADELTRELRSFADALRKESSRAFGASVPAVLSGGEEMALTSTLIYRGMLPGGTLSRTLLPLLVAPTSPRVALVVPKSYWPSDMFEWWLDGQA